MELQVRELEAEQSSMQMLIQNHAFEKRQLMQQIDKLEEKLDQERSAKKIDQQAKIVDVKRRLSLAVDPGEINLLDSGELESSIRAVSILTSPKDNNGSKLLELAAQLPDHNIQSVGQTVATKPSMPDIKSQIITEVAEEDKNSGFGDYGESSADSDDEDEDD